MTAPDGNLPMQRREAREHSGDQLGRHQNHRLWGSRGHVHGHQLQPPLGHAGSPLQVPPPPLSLAAWCGCFQCTAASVAGQQQALRRRNQQDSACKT